MNAFTNIGLGLLAAGVVIVGVRRWRNQSEVPVYAGGLLVAALLYLFFACLEGAWTNVIVEVLGVALFAAIALSGWRFRAALVGWGWGLHAVWDLLLHGLWESGYAPRSYAEVCIGFDLALAGYIVARYRRNGP